MVGWGADEKAIASLAGLDLPESFDLHGLVAAVECARETEIKVREFPGFAPQDGLSGLWFNTCHGDYILHAPAASELHRRQIVLHELAHMILGHDLVAGKSSASELFPDIPKDTVVRVLARGHTDNDMEREAEALADLLARSMRHGGQWSSFSRIFG